MTIPLIQRPGPFQQLQATVDAILAERERRKMSALQMMLGQTELTQRQATTQRIYQEMAGMPEAQANQRAGADYQRALTQKVNEEVRVSQDRAKKQQEAIRSIVRMVGGENAPRAQGILALTMLDPEQYPAQVRQDVYKSILGEQSTDDEGSRRFLSYWRTGALTAEQSAQAAGVPIPTGIPGSMKIPRSAFGFTIDASVQREMTRLSATAATLRNELAQSRATYQRAYDQAAARIGGPGYRRGVALTAEQETRARADATRSTSLSRRYRQESAINDDLQRIQEQMMRLSIQGTAAAGQEPDGDDLDRVINDLLSPPSSP